jgi:hypothetical protein
MNPSQQPEPEQQSDVDELQEQESAWNEVAYSIADLIRRKEIREALKKWVDAQSDNVPKNHSYRIQVLWTGLIFSIIVFAAIIALGVFKVISPEVMVGLLGPMLGYWFGRRSNQ